MSEGHVPLKEMQEAYDFEENMSYECPFSTFTYEYWLDMQATLVKGLARFQRAIEHRRPGLASLIVLDMLTALLKLQQEATAWVREDKRED